MIKISVLAGPDAGSVFTPVHGTIVIGRGSDCDVVLHDSTVSRRHCLIQQDQSNNFALSDLHTANGTFLNGSKIRLNTQHELSNGDEIVFGRSRLRIELLGFSKKGADDDSTVRRQVASALSAGESPTLALTPSQVTTPASTDEFPSNWQSGMTVFARRPKVPVLAQSTATSGRTERKGTGFVASITATIKRLISVLTMHRHLEG
jgi:pSer/pThr/pTyr-binding forkhead associated (FHA) protein